MSLSKLETLAATTQTLAILAGLWIYAIGLSKTTDSSLVDTFGNPYVQAGLGIFVASLSSVAAWGIGYQHTHGNAGQSRNRNL